MIGSGSGFGLDPDSIRSVDPDLESGSGSRRAKMTQKNRSAGCSLLRAVGFSWSLDVLYGGLGISKVQFLIQIRTPNTDLKH